MPTAQKVVMVGGVVLVGGWVLKQLFDQPSAQLRVDRDDSNIRYAFSFHNPYYRAIHITDYMIETDGKPADWHAYNWDVGPRKNTELSFGFVSPLSYYQLQPGMHTSVLRLRDSQGHLYQSHPLQYGT